MFLKHINISDYSKIKIFLPIYKTNIYLINCMTEGEKMEITMFIIPFQLSKQMVHFNILNSCLISDL